jgi:hypothetical protein
VQVTFDWNCIIEVEECRPQKSSVEQLVEYHRAGRLEVGLLAASASENTKSKRFPGNAELFKGRVSALGWNELPIVLMPAVYGLSYWNFCFWVGNAENFERDIDELWQVIAPKVARNAKDHLGPTQKLTDDLIQSQQLSKWRNTWCDVISAYSHIHSKRDVFVTLNTKDFQKHSAKLSELGMTKIATPEDCLELVT